MGDTFQWNGGSGAFSDPAQWTDITTGGTGVPGSADTAYFTAGGDVSGGGGVNFLYFQATVGFDANVTAGYIENDDLLTITGGSLGTANNFINSGSLVINAGTVSTGYLGNTGDVAISGGSLVNNDFISSDGSIEVSGGGSLSTTGALQVGDAATGSLTISGGGQVSAGTFSDVGNQAGSQGDATVTGSGSTWSSAASIAIGNLGTGTLTIGNGATVTAGTFIAIGDQGGGDGTVTISNGGSLSADQLLVAPAAGAAGYLDVTDSGSVITLTRDLGIGNTGDPSAEAASAIAVIENHAAATVGDVISADGSVFDVTNGATLITTGGTNSVPANGPVSADLNGNATFDAATVNAVAGFIAVGIGGTGTLTVSNGATVTAAQGALGQSAGDAGSLILTGADWTDDGSAGLGSGWGGMIVGFGGDGTLDLEASSTLSDSTYGDVAHDAGSTGTVTVDASTWTIGGLLTVGDGGDGTLTIQDAGTVRSDTGWIGSSGGATGAVTVDGAGSTWQNSGGLYVGFGGDGTLTIQNAATVQSDTGWIGFNSGATGAVTVDGAGSTWQNSSGLYVGFGGDGALTIQNAGTVGSDGGEIGFSGGASGFVTIDGAGSTWEESGGLYIGDAGSGTLTVSNGGLLDETGGIIDIGTNLGGDGTLALDGATTTLTFTGELIVGDAGSGELDVSGGASLTVDGDADEGAQAGSTGTVTIDASTWTIGNSLIVGDGGAGTLTIQAGGSVVSGGFSDVGEQAGSQGSATVTGSGSSWDSATSLVIGLTGSGTLAIESGATVTDATFAELGGDSTGDGTVTIDGAGSDWQEGGGLFIGVSGAGTVTISNGGTLDETGGFVDIGTTLGADGTLALSGAGSTLDDNGPIFVGDGGDGTLTIRNSGTVLSNGGEIGSAAGASGAVTVDGAGSTWQDSGGVYIGDAGSGTVTISNGGSFDETGGFIDIGTTLGADGTLALSGAATALTFTGELIVGDAGSGELDVSGGASLTVDGDVDEGVQAGSTGADTISDAGIVVQVAGNLTIGDAGQHAVTWQGGITVDVTGDLVLGAQGTGNGALTVTGPDTTVDVGGALTIGDAGTGALQVTAGGLVDASGSDVSIADQPGSAGTAAISGIGSELNADSLTVGGGGTGALTLDTGGLVNTVADMTLGEQAGSSGTATDDGSSLAVGGKLTVGGSGTGVLAINLADAAIALDAAVGEEAGGEGTTTLNGGSFNIGGKLSVGDAGNGLVRVQLGGALDADSIEIGVKGGATEELDVSGAGSTARSSDLTVGSLGEATLNVTLGGALSTTGDATIADQVAGVAEAASLDTQGQWNLTGGLTVGGAGIGSLGIDGAAQVAAGTDVTIGDQAGSAGVVTVSGTIVQAGTVIQSGLEFGTDLAVGNAGAGTLTVQNGGLVSSSGTGTIDIGAVAGGSGTLTVTGAGSALDGHALEVGGTAGSHGLLQIDTGGVVSVADAQVQAGGSVALAGGELLTDPITLAAGGMIAGYGTVAGAITDGGMIIATGGTLSLTGALTGGGGLEIANAAELDLGNTVASSLGMTFDPAGRDELLSLGKALGMEAPISDFHTSDKIEFGSFTNITTSFAVGTLDVFSAGTLVAALDFVGGYSASDFSVAETGGLVTVTTDVACFLRGTRIMTERGEVPVEALRAGDAVLTPEGAQTVRWIGQRRIDARLHPRPERVWPVRIRRDAIADGVPSRDLLVSPDHGVFVDGVLMPARLLVNGATIRRDDAIRVVRYFHMELARHALLLADGMWAESYLDTGNRGMFENAGAPMILHPDFADAAGQARRAAGSCAPLAREPATVEPIWRRLAGRAAALGHRMAEPATTDDPALRLLADGRCLAPVAATARRSVFILPRSVRHARLVSRAAAPCDLAPWMDDRRRLGVMIRRLTLRRGEDWRSMPLDQPTLTEGWWAVERDGATMWRWTDGDALLPLEGGAAVLEVEAAGMARYPMGPAEAMVAA